MPHTNDKASFKQCVELLDGPKLYHYANRIGGRRVLDTASDGQQRFQALLMRCFNSPDREHPWDVMTGRSFADLRSYLGWVSPHQDRLVVAASVAPRVASYLLPYSREHADGSVDHSGIPGLRLEGCSTSAIRLVHLPTGGVLELQDWSPGSAAEMRRDLDHEVGINRRRDEEYRGRVAVWCEGVLTSPESAAAPQWESHSGTPLLSALMARVRLFWKSNWDTAALKPARRSNSTARIQWRDGYSTTEMGDLLTGPAVGIPAAVFEPATREYEPGLIRLGDHVVELDGPHPLKRSLIPTGRHRSG